MQKKILNIIGKFVFAHIARRRSMAKTSINNI
jgi:hypothetical protein